MSESAATRDIEVELRRQLTADVPSWVQGSLSYHDIGFLLRWVIAQTPRHVVEIGTGSGVSTAVICRALEAAASTTDSRNDYSVATYDASSQLWFDNQRPVGDAAASLVGAESLAHVTFRNPATAVDAAREHDANSVSFVFIDANHAHPWPALDLLALLDCLQAGALVVLHDINLPVLHEEFPVWGAKWVFDELDVVRLAAEGDPPNTGAIVIPADKARLRRRLIEIINSHPWESDVPECLLLELDVQGRPS